MNTVNVSTIKLFKSVVIRSKRTKKASKDLLEKTIPMGFIFSPEVIYNYSDDYDSLIKLVEKTIGITAEKLNSSFHKSWKKVKEADIEQLVVEQLAHYLTTYGKEHPKDYLIEKEEQWKVDNLAEKIIELEDFESNKIKDENYVYIPKEKLDIPELDIDGIKLVVIKGYTKQELKEKLLNILSSGIALAKDTMADILNILGFMYIKKEEIEQIKNREVKIALYEHLGTLPENPIEFLRYVIYKITNKTLLIKNRTLIEELKENTSLSIVKLFNEYEKEYGLNRLAEIFYRFKPIFLALRSEKKLRTITNRIRKLAVKNHKPLPEDYLNTITSKIKINKRINTHELKTELDKVNTFRKIRLAYSLKFRTKDIDSILYRIRNGKSFATKTMGYDSEQKAKTKRILKIVLDSIVTDVSKNVKGKKIYIPDNINYSLPATEKQFTGNFPSGTYVSIPNDLIFGIHWKNVEDHDIDLDLSVLSPTEKIGWDSSYRTDERDILFSGDITNAPGEKGATELFYVKRQYKKALILLVNYYNFNSKVEVPFKIIVAKEKIDDFKKNYMVNPNNVITIADTKINQKQKVLGLVVTTSQGNRFYFTETNLGRSITSSGSEFVENSRKYLFDFYENTINLKDILIKAGAKIIEKKDKSDIDLSPETLERDTLLKLLK